MKKFWETINSFVGRFPAAAVFSAVGVWLAHRLTYVKRHGDTEKYYPYVWAMLAAMAISAVMQTALARSGKSRALKNLATIASIALFAVLALWFRWIGDCERGDFVCRYLLSIGAILALFAFSLAKSKDKERNLPILAGSASMGIAVALSVWGALSLLFLALDKLFNVEISHIYEFLYFISALSIAPTAFVLFATRENVKIGEKSLHLVMDYVLGPLALANLAILVAYLAKCLSGSSLPRGEITWFVSTASTIWIFLSMVFSYIDTSFSSFFRRKVGYAILPLLVLQAIAIGIRIDQYGLTPMRYLASALTLFFAMAAVLSIVRGGRLVRWLYVIFAAMAFFSAIGPLNAIDASVIAQKKRISLICRRNGMGIDNPASIDRIFLESDSRFSDSDKRKIYAALDFISRYRKSCGLYVLDSRARHAPDSPQRSVARRYSHYWYHKTDNFPCLEISEYGKVYPVSINWDSGVATSATEEEIATLMERDLVSVKVETSLPGGREIQTKASLFKPLIQASNGLASQDFFDLDEGLLLVLEFHVRYYKLDESAAPSDTNVVAAEIRAKGLFFERIDNKATDQ